jgi:ectoine hydroxylase
MRLDEQQIATYRRMGLLAVEDVFDAAEVARLRAAFVEDSAAAGPHRVLEDDSLSVRAVYASHLRHPTFARLVRSPQLLDPARQLAGAELYVWQFKINTKRSFGGAAWCWHQDYVVWREFDRMPGSDAVTVAVFLDDVNEFNGPIVFVPGSHRAGVIEPPARAGTPKSMEHVDPEDFELPNATVAALVAQHGLVAPKGAAGSLLLFHPNIVHASGLNISPFRRDLLLATFNPIANAPDAVAEPRAEYLVGRPTAPLTPVSAAAEPA